MGGCIGYPRADHLTASSGAPTLERIQFRGEAPKTPERWYFIYKAIKNSVAIDG